MGRGRSRQDELYEEAAAAFGAAIERLAASYEFDRDKRSDLSQDIHLALWRSFLGYEGRCSLRTWTYRVAHNVATSYVIRHRKAASRPTLSLDDIEEFADTTDTNESLERSSLIERLHSLIHRLQTLDRQIILLYLDGFDAASIGEVIGISPGNASLKVHRIKKILTDMFRRGGHHGR